MAKAKTQSTRSPRRKARRNWDAETRPRKWRTAPAGFRYNVNGTGMSPFFIGLAAAEFLPADPRVWFDAANAAGMTAEKAWSPGFAADQNTENFLKGWLHGTPGGKEALAAWLKQRGYASGAGVS